MLKEIGYSDQILLNGGMVLRNLLRVGTVASENHSIRGLFGLIFKERISGILYLFIRLSYIRIFVKVLEMMILGRNLGKY